MKQLSREKIKRMFEGAGSTVVGGGGNAGGSLAGYATQSWAEGQFVSKDFFNRLFKIHGEVTETDEDTGEETTTEVTVLPNDVQTKVTEIGALFNLYSIGGVTALGRGSGGGGGGGSTTLAGLVDVSLGTLSDGQVLTYNATTGKWTNRAGGGGGTGSVTRVGLSMPAGFLVTGSPVTSSGTLTVGFASGYSLPTTAKQNQWDAVAGATWWGQSLNNGSVSGDLTSVRDIRTARYLYMQNNGTIFINDANGTERSVLVLNNNNSLALGYGTRNAGYSTDIQGYNINFRVNTDTAGSLTAMTIDENGLVNIRYGNQGLKIGTSSSENAVITWDSANAILNIPGYARSSWVTANFGSKGDVDTLKGYFNNGAAKKADQLTNTKTLWGQPFNGTQNVTGTLSDVTHIFMSGVIRIDNNGGIQFKDTSDNPVSAMTFNAYNQLAIGYGARVRNYLTDLQGSSIRFTVDSTGIFAGEFTNAGQLYLRQPNQGLRIGDGVIVWDSANNAFKVMSSTGGVAHLYTTGGLSALGFSGGGSASVSVSTLSVTSALNMDNGKSIQMKDSSAALLKVLSTSGNALYVGEGWNTSGHSTYIRGTNVYLQSGTTTMATVNSSGLQVQRLYLSATTYLYVGSGTLYFYKGSSSKAIIS